MKVINKDPKWRRKRRVKSKIFGTATKPRISVFRSNKHIYAQAIDDKNRVTIAAYSSLNLKKDKLIDKKMTKTEVAKLVGENLAKILKEKNIKRGIFCRESYHYAGRVKSLAEGLRKGG